MGQHRKIAKNTGILMGMELGVRILDAVVAIILARYLAPEGFGLFSFALSFAWIFGMLPGFGMGTLVTRNAARSPELISKYLSNGLVAKGMLSVVTFAVIGSISWGLGHPIDKFQLVILAVLLMIFDTNVRFMLSFFQAAQKMTTLSITNLAIRSGWIIGSLIVIAFGGGVFELLAVRAVASAIGMLVVLIMIDRVLQKIHWTFDFRFMVGMLKEAFPFALFRLYGKVYVDIDTVMLSTMRGDAMTGFYAAAHKVARIFHFIPRSLSGALLPAIAKSTDEELIRAFNRSIKYLLIFSLPVAGGVTVMAGALVELLFGASYSGTAAALQILVWSIVFTFMNSPIVATIAAVNRETHASRNLLYGVLFSSLSNLIVIPLWGHLGAAMTTVLAAAMIYVLQGRVLKKALPELKLMAGTAKPIMATVAMMIFIWMIRGAGLWIVTPIAVIFYSGALILIGAVGKEERKMVERLMTRKKKEKGV